MDEARLEGLLRERGRLLRGALAGEAFTRSAQEALRVERRRRRLRLLAPAALLAAAAALALVLLWGGPRDEPRRGVAFEVALLDASGRELIEGAGVRGAAEDLPPPDVVRLELVARADGFARVYLYDARGRLRAPRAGTPVELRAEQGALVTFELDGAWEVSHESAGLTWLIVCADAPLADAAFALPESLAASAGEARTAELEALAARVRAQTGCEVALRHLE